MQPSVENGHAKSLDSLIDPDIKLKQLIENKYMGRLSLWQMSYVCRPQLQQSESRIDPDLSLLRKHVRRRPAHSCRRSGSMSEELQRTLTRQSQSYWYTNVKLKKQLKPEPPSRLDDLHVRLNRNTTKLKVFFGESKPTKKKEPPEKALESDIISYYREKYEGSTERNVRLSSQQSGCKRRNLPRLTPAKPLNASLKIDPW